MQSLLSINKMKSYSPISIQNFYYGCVSLCMIVLSGLLTGCFGDSVSTSSGGSSGGGGNLSPRIIGIVADGSAIEGKLLSARYADGTTQTLASQTESDGSYKFIPPDDAAFPVELFLTSEDGPQLSTIVIALPVSAPTTLSGEPTAPVTVRHINPISSLVSARVKESTGLQGATEDLLGQQGGLVMASVIGGGVDYGLFNNDPDFIARSSINDQPTLVGGMLETLSLRANELGTELPQLLLDHVAGLKDGPFLADDNFLVELEASLIGDGNLPDDLRTAVALHINDVSTLSSMTGVIDVMSTIRGLAISSNFNATQLKTVLDATSTLFSTALDYEQSRLEVSRLNDAIDGQDGLLLQTLGNLNAFTTLVMIDFVSNTTNLPVTEPHRSTLVKTIGRQAGFLAAHIDFVQDPSLNSAASATQEEVLSHGTAFQVVLKDLVDIILARLSRDLIAEGDAEAVSTLLEANRNDINNSVAAAVANLASSSDLSSIILPSANRPTTAPPIKVELPKE